MGVHGLWKLLEPSGKPVTLESLDNKVLAIDVSMWLHQVMKGYQDSTGNALPNAHLLGLFHRICKLMFYRIKPVFVFDGGVPQLKQQTLASRRQMRGQATKKAERERLKLLRNLMEQGVVRQALVGNKRPVTSQASKKSSAFSDFILDPMAQPEFEESEEEEVESDDECQPIINWDTFNPDAESFKRLPAKTRVEILTDLKEARKQNSWGRIHEMPQESTDFSSYQMKRLLVRRSAQVGLEEAEKELGEHQTLTMAQLQEIMEERGSLASTLSHMENDKGHRIASDTTTRFLLLSKSSSAQKVTEIPDDDDEPGMSKLIRKIKVEPDDVDIVETVEVEEENDDDLEMIQIKSQVETETELSQAEILALIKTANKVQTKVKKPLDLNTPSTSSAGNYDPVDIESPTSQQNESPSKITSNSILESPLTKIYFREAGMQKAMENILGSQNKTSTYDVEVENVKKDLKFEDKPQPVITDELKIALELMKTQNVAVEPEINVEEIEPKIVDIKKNKMIEKPSSPVNISSSDESFEEVKNTKVTKIPDIVPKTPKITPKIPKITPKPIAPKSGGIQIMINADTAKSSIKPEEDIFADIFDTEEKIDEISESETSVESDKEVPKQPLSPKSVEKRVEVDEKAKPPEPEIANNSQEVVAPSITNEDLIAMEESLLQEQANLAGEVGRQERLAVSISDQMCIEAQELLRLFGLPYVIAPMEAEAQCAILDLLSLTQGTVTDDSDIWLFGGRTVYRNFFNQNRSVEVYTADSIQKCFKLSRGQLVLLALLVGSDYTNGLPGIGPVTALEILSAFSSEQKTEAIGTITEQPDDLVAPLRSFRDWWAQRQAVHSARLQRLKSKLKDLSIHEGFPSIAVAEAYIHPEVDDSKEKFTWGKPDIEALIYFARKKFGWSKGHAESILQPVIKRMNDNSVQQRLDSFFSITPQVTNVENKMSSRVREAVNKMGKDSESDDEEEEIKENPASTSNNTRKRAAPSTSDTNSQGSKKVQPVRTSEGKTSMSTLQAMRKALTKKPKPKKIKLSDIQTLSSTSPTINKPPPTVKIPVQEIIPQKEKDKESALKNKLKAIELFRKKKLDPTPKYKKVKQVVKDDHYLSESSSDD